MKNKMRAITIAFILAITSAACEPSEQPAESLPTEPTVQTTTTASQASTITSITIVTTEPVTPPAETTPITEESETQAPEVTYAVPEDASPLPDLDADNVFIIPTLDKILLEFEDIQAESDTLEEELVRLIKRNAVCFDLFVFGGAAFSVNYRDYFENGITIVKSDYFKSYSQITDFLKMTLTNEAAEERLGRGRFIDIDGVLYFDKNTEWVRDPFVENTILEIVSVSDNTVSCRYYINDTDPNRLYYREGVKQEVYIVKEFDVVKEDGKWKLPDIMFDNGLHIYRTSVYTDEKV